MPDSDAEQSSLPSATGHQSLQEGNAVEQRVNHSDWQPGKKHIVPWGGGGSTELCAVDVDCINGRAVQDPDSD